MSSQKKKPISGKSKMIYAILSYTIEVIATVLIVLTLSRKIENEKLIFYIVWVMGLMMSAFSGIRDSTIEAPTPDILFPKILFWSLTIIGVLCGILLMASFFKGVSDYRVLLIILAVMLSIKWLITHGYKIYGILAK